MALSKAISALLFLAFLCPSSPPAMALATTPDFDFYYLVLMWPASYCYHAQEGCCFPTTGKPQLDFFVRGLVPYNSATGNAVTGCKGGSRFNVNSLQEFIGDMYGYWSSIKCPSNNGLSQWKGVWSTYGVCSNLDQAEYFRKALALRAKVDLLPLFKKNGIVPSGTDFYRVRYIKKAIEYNLGVSVGVECNKNKWDESQLYKVYICVDKDASTIISCPIVPKSDCAKEVTFGLFTYDMLTDTTTRSVTHPIKMPSQGDLIA